MDRKELGLVGAASISTGGTSMRIQRGDMLRENSSRKILKVAAVYRRYSDGEYFLECEDMEPGSFGSSRIVSIDALSIIMG